MEQFSTRGIVPITYRKDGSPIWPMAGGAEGELAGTAITDLPRSSYAYCEPNDGPCHFPIKDKDGKPDAAHVRNALARLSQSPFGDKARPAVEAAAREAGIGEPAAMAGRAEEFSLGDGSFLVRSLPPEFDYGDGESVRAVDLQASREGADPASPGYLRGRFAVFDTWTEVRSQIEGHFMERTADSAFSRTLAAARPPIIFNHGWHPQVGTAPIAPTEEIGTDTRGGYYGGPLLNGVPDLIVSGLRAGLYASSHRFRSTRPPETNVRPKPSAYNPQGLPEITIREAALKEVGPGMFPVYKDTSAIVRSETDDFVLSRFGDPEHVRTILAALHGDLALPTDGLGIDHSVEGPRSDPPLALPIFDHPKRFRDREEWLDYLQHGRTFI